jgi:hypothetical protein
MGEDFVILSDMLLIRVGFKPQTMQIEGKPVRMSELGHTLPFARKPVNLGDFACGTPQRVFVHQHHPLTQREFDEFAGNLTRSRTWLANTARAMPIAHARACVMVTAPQRPILFIDTEGSDYARYVARLG